ncbi:hypothetical protein ABFS82_09G012800 [Erythranthe guttata]|uniref:Cytochrome P450 n=1 Tax=Erythranthe guttata TaxID=4155 RepID=A0A022Q3H5_ERYGU|nr:PREDICTED: cytochrome P450 71A6-like [Erythranthe guttata]EYU22199.1 hypothetical protein MIMGU_mgv1a004576mg [Erythranthe guttata]|eukprot:XP_012855697.1 PREDICTED: cytochrome P450 71A6-like [Erythranthe guttata]
MVSFTHFLILFFPLASFLIFLYKWQHLRRNHTGKRLPPSPRKIPVIGNLHQLGPLPHRSLQSLSQKHGPLMLLHFGRVPVLVATSAEAAREIMKNQDLIFSNRPKLTIPDKLMYESRDVAFSRYGEYWRKMKSICVLQLLSTKRVHSFRRVREEETSLMVDNIAKLLLLPGCNNNNNNNDDDNRVVINLSDMFILLMNDVLCRVVLGRKYSGGEDDDREFKTMSHESSILLGTFCVADYINIPNWLGWLITGGLYAKVDKLAKRLDRFLESVVEEHRSKIGENTSTDFVDILLETQRENGKDHIDDDAVKAIILDIFVAGTDTTYTVLEWAMTELLRYPNTMSKLQNEVRKVVGENKEFVTEDDLDKMHYLKAVIKESLRLHTPVPLLAPRESIKDTKVMGYDVAAGTHVLVNAWSIARDPTMWENPEEFNPDRFMNTDVDFKGQHFEYIPFGAGRRGCPGITFAMVVNELALAKLVHRFNFDLPDNDGGARKNDSDVAEAAGLTVRKKFPLFVVATPSL